MTKFYFPHSEHLKSRKTIASLFREGKSLKAFPMRFQYIVKSMETEEQSMNIGFVVPKKHHKLAVKRNRLKRQIKESFRLNRELLQHSLANKNLHLDMMIIFINSAESDYKHIDKAMKKAIEKLCERL